MPTITGTARSDRLEGTSGSDKMNAGDGNDFMFYNVPANSLPATSDVYSGGGGIDMAVLRFSYDQWINPDNQKQLERYFSWRDTAKLDSAGQISNGSNSDFTFKFGASTLTLQMTEQLGVMVDGNFLRGPFAVYKRNAPQANDDNVVISEDDGAVTIDVLNSSRPGEADSVPDLVKNLRVLDNAGPSHGTVTLLKDSSNPADWKFIYTVDNAYYQNLPQVSSGTDSFRYQITDASGATSSATVQITIRGLNDPARIAARDSYELTEDLNPTSTNKLQLNGQLSLSDPDAGESQFNTVVAAAPDNLGTLQLQTDGSFIYEIDNADVQYLSSGIDRTEVFTVASKDGSASKDISFIIKGVNDPARIAGQDRYELTEDLDPTPTNKLRVTDQLSISDPDAGESQFYTVVAAATGTLGTLKLQTGGSFTYEINNADVQYLDSGEERTEMFTVVSRDGATTKNISFVINGVSDDVAPQANPDVLWVTDNASVSLPTSLLLANDTDEDSDKKDLKIVSFSAAPGSGAAPTLSTDGLTFSFDASALVSDQVDFNYVVSDETSLTRQGKVTVNVQSLDDLSNDVLDLQEATYTGAYLVGNSQVTNLAAGNGPTVLIGDPAASSVLQGGESADVLLVGDDVDLPFDIKLGAWAQDTVSQVENADSVDLTMNGNCLEGGAAGDSVAAHAGDDQLSIGRSLRVTLRSDVSAYAESKAASASSTFIFTQQISDNQLLGDLKILEHDAVGGADTLALGVGMDLRINSLAFAAIRPDSTARAEALSQPVLEMVLSTNRMHGDAEIVEGSQGGDDMLKFCDSVALVADTQSLMSSFFYAGQPRTVAQAGSKLKLIINANELYGDAESMDDGSAGKDFLSFANDLNITSTDQKVNSDAYKTILQIIISNNNLYGDAKSMNQSQGDDDLMKFGRDWQYDVAASTTPSRLLSDNSLYGDAYTMSGSTGGNDVLISTDLAGSTTYLTGDSCESDLSSVGGDDTLIGGAGDDHMWGDFGGKEQEHPADHGAFGNDVFRFSGSIGHDIIYDFHLNEDVIEFLATGSPQFNFSNLAQYIFASGNDTLISFDSVNSITLVGILPDQLTADDFRFVP